MSVINRSFGLDLVVKGFTVQLIFIVIRKNAVEVSDVAAQGRLQGFGQVLLGLVTSISVNQVLSQKILQGIGHTY